MCITRHVRGAGAVVLGSGLWIAAAMLSITPAAAAIPECTAAQLSLAAPAGMVIGDVPNIGSREMPKTVGGVAYVPANVLGDGAPEYCFVTGSVVTNPATKKTANFGAALPAKTHWNGKFMFQGCGGNCGTVFMGKPSAGLLSKGYPLFATDDGHISKAAPAARLWQNSESSWAVSSPGRRDDEAVTDFFYRAVHAVVLQGKELTKAFYGTPHLDRAYFEGCSDGGREGMVELARFPRDFDGIIAGDPYFDIGGEVANSLVGIKVQLRSRQAALTREQLSQIDQIVMSACDASDGVTDGLIQNPANCRFSPQRDLRRCGPSNAGRDCFTQDQMDSVSAIFSAITDRTGRILYPGYPVSDLSKGEPSTDNLGYWLAFNSPPDSLTGPEPWARDPGSQPQAWFWANQTSRYLIYADPPNFNALKTLDVDFEHQATASSSNFHATLGPETVARLQRQSAPGNGNVPADAAGFFRHGGKLILYHGYSDGDITPFRTIQYYRALASLHGGYGALQAHARLFMVPGMAHCGAGPAPNSFGQFEASPPADPAKDIVAALENWVEKGRPPSVIVATKFEHDDAKAAVLRTMPLCPYPAMARYEGHGDVNDAAHWTCPSSDQGLLQVGRTGLAAGSNADLN
jgi:hypothetical protein